MSVMPASAPAPIESWEVLDLPTALMQKSLVVYEEDEQGMSEAGAALPAAGDGAAVCAGPAIMGQGTIHHK